MSEEPLVSEPSVADYKRELKRRETAIKIGSYIAYILVVIAIIFIGASSYVSTTLSADKRVWITILGVCGIGLIIVVFVSRIDPVALVIFSVLSVAVSMLATGLSISYL